MKNKKRSPYAFVKEYTGKHYYFLTFSKIFAFISAIANFAPYISIWHLIKIVIENNNVITDSIKPIIYRDAILAGVLGIVGILIYFISLMFSHLCAFRLESNLKIKSAERMLKMPLGYFDINKSSVIRKNLDENIIKTHSFVAHNTPDIIAAFSLPIVLLVLTFVINYKVGLLALIAPVSGLLIITMSMIFMGTSMKKYMDAQTELATQSQEYVKGMPVIKTFQQTVYTFEKFSATIREYGKWAYNYAIRYRWAFVIATTLTNLTFVVLVPYLIAKNRTLNAIESAKLVSDTVFYIMITGVQTTVLMKIMGVMMPIAEFNDSVNRIEETLNYEPIPFKENDIKITDENIEFKNVSFAYPSSDKEVLHNVSFKCNKSELIGIVGASGSGKSTILKLIPRFYDIKSGSITIGGIDIRELSEKELLSNVSFVFQQTKLFQGSIKENLLYAKADANDDELYYALEKACCRDVVDALPNKLDSIIGSKGVYLSGGEQQRIILARAFLKTSKILLLDEATAFADPENESKIQQALSNLIKDKTVIMIAHRLSSITNANKIIIVDDGMIKEEGTHNELLDKNGIYTTMYNNYIKAAKWRIDNND